MQWHLKSLIGQYNSAHPDDQLTYRRIAEETGLSLSSISQIANNNTTHADFSTMETLLRYFSKKMERQVGVEELVVYTLPDEKE